MRPLRCLFLVGILLSGCSTKIVSSNERSVIVSAVYMKKEEAFRLADNECKKFSRVARFVPNRDELSMLWTFDCQP